VYFGPRGPVNGAEADTARDTLCSAQRGYKRVLQCERFAARKTERARGQGEREGCITLYYYLQTVRKNNNKNVFEWITRNACDNNILRACRGNGRDDETGERFLFTGVVAATEYAGR
jgi:hypothetical protein